MASYSHFPRKQFVTYQNHLVSDPNDSIRTGDIVRIARAKKISRHIDHVVTEIVAPWGPKIEERPPVMSLEELEARWRVQKEAKTERKRLRNTHAEGQGGPQEVVEGTKVIP